MATELAGSHTLVQHGPDKHSSSLRKLKAIGHKAKKKTKSVLGVEKAVYDSDSETSLHNAALDEINENPAFNSAKFQEAQHEGSSTKAEKATTILQSAKGFLAHPKETIQNRAAKQTAGKMANSRPYLSRQANLEFLAAFNDLEDAEQALEGVYDGEETLVKEANIHDAEERIEGMERERQSMRVAWITARHVERVRAVPDDPPVFPPESFFETKDDFGYTEFHWGKWIGYQILARSHRNTAQYIDDFEQLPFDVDALRRSMERLIIVSAPLQEWMSDIRSIYRYDDPLRTLRWLFIVSGFTLLEVFVLVVLFPSSICCKWAYFIYVAAINYFYPVPLKGIRLEIERTVNRGATAYKIGELMDEKGQKDWVGPLLEELGPFIQLQLADFANILEVCYNYSHFRSPAQSAKTLTIVAVCFLFSATASLELSMKAVVTGIGFIFFVCWPISSLYPGYRLLVSPVKWLFWNIPTHSESAFQYLQDRAAAAREELLAARTDKTHHAHPSFEVAESDLALSDKHPSTTPKLLPDPDHDVISFHCTSQHIPGHLILSISTLRFVALPGIKALPHHSFHKPYTSIVEMSKLDVSSVLLKPLAQVTTGMDKLELKFRLPGLRTMGEAESCETVMLEHLGGRDKAFNAIVGFSGVKWQCLQQRMDQGGGI